uniref:Uncharacterized protein n=1 Tax=Romanomermis culicivorax TaxID=13658 RepID=A0A915L588_ROMCU
MQFGTHILLQLPVIDRDVFTIWLAEAETGQLNFLTRDLQGKEVSWITAKACGGVMDSTFEDLCAKPLGAADYLALSQVFHTILVRNVPKLNLDTLSNESRRFITMIDAFYDHKVRLILSSHQPLDNLFDDIFNKDTHSQISSMKDSDRLLMDDLKINEKELGGEKASVFTNEEEMFALERTISRLTEMQSLNYWKDRETSKS